MILKIMSCLSGMPLKTFSDIKKFRNLQFALKLGLYDNTGTKQKVFWRKGRIMLFWKKNGKLYY